MTNAPHLFIGHKIKVYRNLLKPTFWSLKTKGLDGSKEKVQGYFQSATIVNVNFTVQPAAQKKIFNGGERCVHAYAIGTLSDLSSHYELNDLVQVEYNPKNRDCFYVVSNGMAVTKADAATFINNKMYCLNPR